MFDIKMVTTDKGNRRSGLGTDLLRRSVQLASSLGYKVIYNIHTQKKIILIFTLYTLIFNRGHQDRGNRAVLQESF